MNYKDHSNYWVKEETKARVEISILTFQVIASTNKFQADNYLKLNKMEMHN